MIWSRQHHRQKKKDYVINCFVKFVKFWYNPITNICNECGAIITCNPYFSIHLSNNLLLFLLGASGFAGSPNTSDSNVAQKSKGRNCPVKNGHGAGADGPAMRKQAAFGLAAGGGIRWTAYGGNPARTLRSVRPAITVPYSVFFFCASTLYHI